MALGPLAHDLEHAAAWFPGRWSTAAGRQEAEARTLLVRVPQPAAMGVALMTGVPEDGWVEHRRPSSLPRREDTDAAKRNPPFTAVSETTWNDS